MIYGKQPDLNHTYFGGCWSQARLTGPLIPAKYDISVMIRDQKFLILIQGLKNKSGSLKCFNPDNLSGLTFHQKLKYMLDFVFKHVIPTCYVLILTDIPIIQV